jgi:hypothetical protein
MLTQSILARLTRLAGEGYRWDIPANTARLSSDPRAGLRVWLASFQNGKCAFCGEALDERFDICHVVSGGENRKGWYEGNLAAGCRECNELDGANGPVIAFETIVRPDLIPQEWPAIPVLARAGRAAKQETLARKERKAIARGMAH